MSIFKKLFRMFLFVVLTPLIPLAALLLAYNNHMKNESLETHLNMARMAASAMSQHIDNLSWRTAFAAQLENTSKTAGIKILNDALAANPDFLMLAALDKNGAQSFSAGIKPVLELIGTVDLSADDTLPRIREEGHINISSFDEKAGLPIVEMVAPLKDGRFLFGVVSFYNFWARLAEQKIAQTGRIFLVDQNGEAYVFSKEPPPFNAQEMRKVIEQGSVLVRGLEGANGQKLVGALWQSPVAGAYVAVLQDKEEAYKNINYITLVLIFFLLATASLSYFAALRFTEQISTPVNNLMEASKRVAAGDYLTPVPEDGYWEEFNKLITSFNAMTQDISNYQDLKVKQQTAEIKEFVFKSAAHDLRAPVLAIQGYAQLLSLPDLPEKDRAQYIKTMNAALSELISLLEDVLDMSKLEAGMLHPKKEKFDFKDALSPALASVEHMAAAKKIKLKKELHSKAQFSGDKKMITRVLTNLLTNAVKFTDEGEITVTYNADKEKFYVSVADTGIGMEEDKNELVFDKYRQLDERVKGWGLGLAICRQIVQAHGGEIDIKSSTGQGTTVSFYTLK